MFGVDDEELAGWRGWKPRRLRAVVVLVEVLLALVAVVPFAVVDQVYRPGGLQPLIDRFLGGRGFRLTVDDVVFLPVGRVLDPDTWALATDTWAVAVTGLGFEPADGKKPRWSVRYGTIEPSLARTPDRRWVFGLGDAVVTGLVIEARQQRPPPPWTPAVLPVAQIRADSVHIRDASFTAPEDEPLGAVEVVGIRARLADVRYDPGAREVSAGGTATASRLTTGAITVTAIDLPVFGFDRSSLHLEGGFRFAGADATLVGDIERFHVKSAVKLNVAMAALPLRAAVEAATGRDSPLDGTLGLRMTVRSGGDLPRGGAVIEGSGRWLHGTIQLGPKTRYLVLDLLRVAPWVDVDAARRVLLKDMKGSFRFTRGKAELRDLTYPAGERTIRLDGSVSRGTFYAMVRLLPRRPERGRPGLGVVLTGGTGEQLGVRLVEKADVQRPDPWDPPAAAAPSPR